MNIIISSLNIDRQIKFTRNLTHYFRYKVGFMIVIPDLEIFVLNIGRIEDNEDRWLESVADVAK